MAYPSPEEAQAARRTGSVVKICPVRQCDASIKLDAIMCPAHWGFTTGALRRALLGQWVRGRMPHEQPKAVQLLIAQAKDQAWEISQET